VTEPRFDVGRRAANNQRRPMETKLLIELGGRELGVVFLCSNGTCDLFLFQILFIFGTAFCMSN